MTHLLRCRVLLILVYACLVSGQALNAQNGNKVVKDGVLINTVTTAVPFLRIDPDARAGGMGDVGIASPVDGNSMYLNPAKMAFVEQDFGFGVSFSPWLKALVNDIYLANLNGYYKIKKMQTISASIRYFSLGNIQFTDANGTNLNQFRPNEFAIDVQYARKLGDYFSIAASLRFIYSNLAAGQQVDGLQVKPGIAGSGDIAWYFRKKFHENDEKRLQHEFACGMYISNIGSKISYTSSLVKDFIPTNLGIGFGYTLDIDKHNSIGIYTDFNKLLVPTPDTAVDRVTGIYKFREQSSIGGIFSSFSDAPGGFSEELRQITIAGGVEYYYNKQFGVRTGYFYEPITNGGREYLTAGLTVKYSIATLNFSYLIPTTIQRNPLDNTLRFTLLFDFPKGGAKPKEGNSGFSLVPDTPKKDTKKEKDVKPKEAPVTPPAPLDPQQQQEQPQEQQQPDQQQNQLQPQQPQQPVLSQPQPIQPIPPK